MSGGYAMEPSRKMTRVQLDLPSDRVDQLDKLAEEMGMGTRKDLFNNAIALLQWAVKEARRGRAIASVDERAERMTELHMPFLSAIALDASRTPRLP